MTMLSAILTYHTMASPSGLAALRMIAASGTCAAWRQVASHSGLTIAQETFSAGREHECIGANSSRNTLMLATLGLWIVATGIVALSFECLGAALVLFGIAGLLIGHA
jgi:hypothetical protein